MGGVKNEVCKFKAISIAKKYGLTPKNSTNGKNIGTNMINISVHSRGQPNKNIINWVITKNCQGCKFKDLKKCSNTSWPPKYENTEAKVQDPINNHMIIAVVFAVRKTDYLKFFHLSVL